MVCSGLRGPLEQTEPLGDVGSTGVLTLTHYVLSKCLNPAVPGGSHRKLAKLPGILTAAPGEDRHVPSWDQHEISTPPSS